MKHRFTAFMAFLMVCLGICCMANGSQASIKHRDFYMDVAAIKSGGSIWLNGFPVFSGTNVTRHMSRVVSAYVKDGNNTLRVFYNPGQKANPNSRISVTIKSVPSGASPTSPDAHDIKKYVVRSKDVRLTGQNSHNCTIIVGKRDSSTGFLEFSSFRKSWVLACRMNTKDDFDRIPSAIQYIYLGPKQPSAKVAFYKSGADGELAFLLPKFVPGVKTVQLDNDSIVAGRDLLFGHEFDTFVLSIPETKSNSQNPPTLHSLHLLKISRTTQKTLNFHLSGVHQYSWQLGSTIKTLSKSDKSELWSRISKIYSDIRTGNTESLKKIMRYKARDLSFMTGKSYAEIITSLDKAFTVSSKGGTILRPIHASDIRWVRLNKHVVAPRVISGGEVIESNPTKGPYGNRSVFSIKLHFARIGGEWVVVE